MVRALFMSRKFNHTSIELTALRVWRQSVARAGMALITVLIISSCSSAPPVPEDHYYRLQAVHAGEQKGFAFLCLQGGIDPRHDPLTSRFFIAGGAVDLASKVQSRE